MKNTELLDSIGEIDFDMVEDASTTCTRISNKAKFLWMKWVSVVACFCISLGALFFIIPLIEKNPVGVDPSEDISGEFIAESNISGSINDNLRSSEQSVLSETDISNTRSEYPTTSEESSTTSNELSLIPSNSQDIWISSEEPMVSDNFASSEESSKEYFTSDSSEYISADSMPDESNSEFPVESSSEALTSEASSASALPSEEPSSYEDYPSGQEPSSYEDYPSYEEPSSYEDYPSYEEPSSYENYPSYEEPSSYENYPSYEEPSSYEDYPSYEEPSSYEDYPSGEEPPYYEGVSEPPSYEGTIYENVSKGKWYHFINAIFDNEKENISDILTDDVLPVEHNENVLLFKSDKTGVSIVMDLGKEYDSIDHVVLFGMNNSSKHIYGFDSNDVIIKYSVDGKNYRIAEYNSSVEQISKIGDLYYWKYQYNMKEHVKARYVMIFINSNSNKVGIGEIQIFNMEKQFNI